MARDFHPLIKDIPELTTLSRLSVKAYSLIQGYSALWAVTNDDGLRVCALFLLHARLAKGIDCSAAVESTPNLPAIIHQGTSRPTGK